jgi:hypothetical protein
MSSQEGGREVKSKIAFFLTLLTLACAEAGEDARGVHYLFERKDGIENLSIFVPVDLKAMRTQYVFIKVNGHHYRILRNRTMWEESGKGTRVFYTRDQVVSDDGIWMNLSLSGKKIQLAEYDNSQRQGAPIWSISDVIPME